MTMFKTILQFIAVLFLAFYISFYPLKNTAESAPNRNNDAELKHIIQDCVRARTDKGQVCEETRGKLKTVVRNAGIKRQKEVLRQVGRERSELAREHMWTIISDFNGPVAAQSLREFYMEGHGSPPANFYQNVRFRFKEISTQDDV